MNILRPDNLAFPNLQTANREGLLALGGDLSVPRLLLAYRSGIFPWTDEPLTWWSPDPRAIFEIDRFQPPKRLESKLRHHPFKLTFDHDFSSVIHACAEPGPGRESTWISPRFIEAYLELHRQGHAHSVEAWQDGQLVGGIYGVAIRGFFRRGIDVPSRHRRFQDRPVPSHRAPALAPIRAFRHPGPFSPHRAAGGD